MKSYDILGLITIKTNNNEDANNDGIELSVKFA